MLDAVVLADNQVVTTAIGIDTQGNKHILGYQKGSSENTEVTKDLLSSLRERHLHIPSNRRLLVLLDGSKALKKAVLLHYPDAIIQRCLVHKERNLRGYLSRKDYTELARLFKRLRRCEGLDAATEAYADLKKFILGKNAQAQASLAEAEGEMIAIFALNLPNTLHVSLLSTNIIENSFRNLRGHLGRVCNWKRAESHTDLWLTSGFTIVEKGFRKIKGHKDIGKLEEALSAAKLDGQEETR